MTLSQRSFNLAIAILISLLAFKLLTPLVLPFTWNPTVRNNQVNHLPISIQLIAFFISCGLSLTTPLIVGWRNNNKINRNTYPILTKPTTPPPKLASLAYLLILLGQIILSINFIYTNSNSLAYNFTFLDGNKLERGEFISILVYGILLFLGAIWGVCRKGKNKNRDGMKEGEGEIQLMEREDGHHGEEEEEGMDENQEIEEFEELELGERVRIANHPGNL